ncbi:hypothetical protein BamMEX5DRAFT_4337 [Burkholderia ambifaria MEX-5]|uniref:Uncharacterized protein n=1 Tax=Burkholderia ambifaria MEX-5 TaxID=396597 RepID=B1T971_9BURK|nr:hypothetical protein BamMEX5DRAFT_4337 [Burkholderia ambifaria MEX-5]
MRHAEQLDGELSRCSFLLIASCHVTTSVQDRELTGWREKPKRGARPGGVERNRFCRQPEMIVMSIAAQADPESTDSASWRRSASTSSADRVNLGRRRTSAFRAGRPSSSTPDCTAHSQPHTVTKNHHRSATLPSSSAAASRPTSSSAMRIAATGAASLPVPVLRHRRFATTVHRDAAHSDRVAHPSWASTARRHAPLPTP